MDLSEICCENGRWMKQFHNCKDAEIVVFSTTDMTSLTLISPDVQTGSETHRASYAVSVGFLFPSWYSVQGLKLTAALHLLPKLGMSGAIRLLPYTPS
jgi:hypothetical protein